MSCDCRYERRSRSVGVLGHVQRVLAHVWRRCADRNATLRVSFCGHFTDSFLFTLRMEVVHLRTSILEPISSLYICLKLTSVDVLKQGSFERMESECDWLFFRTFFSRLYTNASITIPLSSATAHVTDRRSVTSAATLT